VYQQYLLYLNKKLKLESLNDSLGKLQQYCVLAIKTNKSLVTKKSVPMAVLLRNSISNLNTRKYKILAWIF
jgi:hypothetical protein